MTPVHLAQARLPFIKPFQFLQQGIRVSGQWYPIVKMEWVEGLKLHQLVEKILDRPAQLRSLADIWVKLARDLRQARIAHGDLQHGNVLFVPVRENVVHPYLVDYDGMWVPALADKPPPEKGHPNYQHPQRLQEGTYDETVDAFSHLVIHSSLQILAKLGRSFFHSNRTLWLLVLPMALWAFWTCGSPIDAPVPPATIAASPLVIRTLHHIVLMFCEPAPVAELGAVFLEGSSCTASAATCRRIGSGS